MKEMSDDLSHKFNDLVESYQQKKIASLEAYSKFYNLKFFNIPETPNETTDILLQRLHHILQMMELDWRVSILMQFTDCHIVEEAPDK